MQAKVLQPGHQAFLRVIGVAGWRQAGIESAALEAGLPADELRTAVGDRYNVLTAFQDHVSSEAVQGAASATGGPRERLFDGVMQGFDALQAHRAAVISIWKSRDPAVGLVVGGRAPVDLRRLAIAAGVDVGGLRGQLRLAALSLLAVTVFRRWLTDESADLSATMAELDSLLEKAERAETDGVSPDLIGLPGLSALSRRLSALLPGGRRGNGDQALQPSPDPQAE